MEDQPSAIARLSLRSRLIDRLQTCWSFQGNTLSQATLSQATLSQATLSQTSTSRTSTQNRQEPVEISLVGLESLYLNDIPVNRNKSGRQIQYISALAFKLSQQVSRTDPVCVSSVAAQLVRSWEQVSSVKGLSAIDRAEPLAEPSAEPWTEQFWANWQLSLRSPGWLQFQLSDPGIAAWLQLLLITSVPGWSESATIEAAQTRGPDRVGRAEQTGPDQDWQTLAGFTILQAHARCCTLLDWVLPELGLSRTLPQSALPWLTSDRQLRFETEAEWQLLFQISDTLDLLAQSDRSRQPQQGFKAALKLSQVLQKLDADCRIWGIVKLDPSLAIVRLGLVELTRRLLRLLLLSSPYAPPSAL